MRDPENGGYYCRWRSTERPRTPEAIIRGGLCHLRIGRIPPRQWGFGGVVSGHGSFRVIQSCAHDASHRGWTEHFERNWAPLPSGIRMPSSRSPVSRAPTPICT